MTIEVIIGIVVVLLVVIYFANKDKGLDVNQDGKVDLADAKAAVENTVVAVEEKVEEAVEEVKKTVKKKTTKKPATKKVETVDLESLNKTQLLEEAKKRGIAANASLKKEEILERLKNG